MRCIIWAGSLLICATVTPHAPPPWHICSQVRGGAGAFCHFSDGFCHVSHSPTKPSKQIRFCPLQINEIILSNAFSLWYSILNLIHTSVYCSVFCVLLIHWCAWQMETTNKKKFNCIICDKTFLTSKKLRRHIAGTHNQETYECDKCDKSFTYKGNLSHHLQQIHEKIKYYCGECPYQASTAQALKNHKDSIHLNKTFQCPSCDYKATFYANLRRHIKLVHEGRKAVHLCTECTKSYSTSNHLQRHVNSAHKKIKYSCNICNMFEYGSETSLKTHILVAHEKGRRSFKCEACGQAFSHKSVLTSHMKYLHSSGEQYKCNVCEKTFYKIQSFIVHEKSKVHKANVNKKNSLISTQELFSKILNP